VYHYTYLSKDLSDGRLYIGSRSCKCKPEKDLSYYGSFKDKTFKPTYKLILKTFKTRKEAFKHEIYLHDVLDVAANPLFANRAKATTHGFSWAGQSHDQETRKKISDTLKKNVKSLSQEERRKRFGKSKGRKLSPKEIEERRTRNLGKKLSEETKNKIRQKALGRKPTPEAILKNSLAHRERWVNRKDQSKPITLQHIVTKEIKSFVSQKEAVRQLDLKQASVNKLATGRQKCSKGWVLYSD
jgi:hypothetical protein